MLTSDEPVKAQSLILGAQPEEYVLQALYGSDWKSLQSLPTFGKRFKQAVRDQRLRNIRFATTATDNHALYEVYE